jgi:alkanesulfonate monooxygenase
MRFADAPARIGEQAWPVRRQGVEVGLRLSVICRSRRDEALRHAQALLDADSSRPRAQDEDEFVRRTDAVSMRETYALGEHEWLTPWLWTGAVRMLGATAICLLGTPDDVAAGLREFRAAGITQFILSGWPNGEEMIRFGADVLPLIRKEEDEAPAVVASPSSGTR